MPLSPGARIDRYEIVRFLGEGGMAHVWELRHTVLGTRHALKVLRSGCPSHRLLREGRVQARLEHPNVVPVTDALEVDGAPALVLPLVDGPGLDDLLAAGPVRRDDALALFHGLVAGVAHVHAHGLVHRDLKPSNVLLDLSSGVVVPRVTDFGLVKADDAYRTALQVRLGSPGYAAPEQLRDAAAADARADLWSLGVMLVELLTGRRPEGAPALEDPALQALASDLLQPDPARRPATAEDLLRRVAALAPPAPAPALAVRVRALRDAGPDGTTSTEPAEPTAVTAADARYRRDAELGRGGGGVVWRVWDTVFERPAALKELPLGAAAGEEARARFLAEAQAIARLDHPNVVRLYEFGEQDGRLFLTMELVEGSSLRDRIERDGPLSVDDAVAVGLAVARALDHIHHAGLLHRDVKPANVLLGPDGRVVLADFGLAVSERVPADARLTRTGQLLGTPAYLAPERLMGAEATPASDVYALGVMLYEALAGHPPYEGVDVVDLLERIRTERVVPLQVAAVGVPRSLVRIVERGMAWDPADRFASAGAFAQALEDFARGADPSVSLGVSARARTAWRRHRRLGLAAVVAVGSVLAAALGQAVWSSRAARAEHAFREHQAEARLQSVRQVVDRARSAGRLDEAEAALLAFAAVEAHAGTRALGESWLTVAEVRRARREARRTEGQVVNGVQDGELEALASAFGATSDPEVQRSALLSLAVLFDEGERPDSLSLALEDLVRRWPDLAEEPEVMRLRVAEAVARWDLRTAASYAARDPDLPMASVVAALARGTRTAHADGVLHRVDGTLWLVDRELRDAGPGEVVAWEVRGPALETDRRLVLGEPVDGADLSRARSVRHALYVLGPDQVRPVTGGRVIPEAPIALPEPDGGLVRDGSDGDEGWAHVGPWPAVTRWGSYAYAGLLADVVGGAEPEIVLSLGEWYAFGVYVFGIEDGEVRLKTRVRTGVVSDLAPLPGGRLLALKSAGPPSRLQMPGGTPFGLSPGLLVLEAQGDELVLTSTLTGSHLDTWNVHSSLALADVDGDGLPEAVLGRPDSPEQVGITIVGLGADGSHRGSVWLPGARLVGVASLDDDPADELVVSLDGALWTLGAGDDALPARPKPVRAERTPPPLGDPHLAAVWGRAEALAAIGLAGPAAVQLAAAAAVAADPVEGDLGRVRASELFVSAGRPEEAAEVARPALDGPPRVADGAREALRHALLGKRDYAAAAEIADADAALLRMANAGRLEVLNPSEPLDPAWRVHEPAALSVDPVGRGLQIRATSNTAVLASFPLVRTGDWVGLEVGAELERMEWGARVWVQLVPVDDPAAASLRLEHRTHGGGGVYARQTRCSAHADARDGWLYLPNVRATADEAGAVHIRGELTPGAAGLELSCASAYPGAPSTRRGGAARGGLAERYRLELRTDYEAAPMLVRALISSLVLHGLAIEGEAPEGPLDAAARALSLGQPLQALELLEAVEDGPEVRVLRWQAHKAAGEPARGLRELLAGADPLPHALLAALRQRPDLLRAPLRELWGDRWYPRFWAVWASAGRMHPADPAVVEPILDGLTGIERVDLGPLAPLERSRVVDALIFRGSALLATGRRAAARRTLELAEADLEAWPDLPVRDRLADDLTLALVLADVADGDLERAEDRLLAAVDRAPHPLGIVDRVRAADGAAPLRDTGAVDRAEARAMQRERGL